MPKKNPVIEAALAPVKAELEATKAAALADIGPLHAQRDALIAQIQPLESQLRAVQQIIKAKEAPIRAVGNDLAAIARAIGGTSMPLDSAPVVAEGGEAL